MLYISSHNWAQKHLNDVTPKYIISLMDDATSLPTPKEIEPNHHLKIDIRDFPDWQRVVCRGVFPPSLKNGISKLVRFGDQWNGEDDTLVHCEMGLSRSPAAAIILAYLKAPDNIRSICLDLRQNCDFILPNSFLIEAADQFLSAKGQITEAVVDMGLPDLGKPEFPLSVNFGSTTSSLPNIRHYSLRKQEKRLNFDQPFSGSSREDGFFRLKEEELVDELSKHEQWLQSKGRKGKQGQFFNINLSGSTFSQRNLSRAQFVRCDMRRATFRKTDISETKFFGCDLGLANFQNVKADRTEFLHTHIENADFQQFRGEDIVFASCFLDGIQTDNVSASVLGGAKASR